MYKTHLTVIVPADLKEAAKHAGVNFSRLMEMALKEAIGWYATKKISVEDLAQKLKQKESEAAALRARLKQALEEQRKQKNNVTYETVWSDKDGFKGKKIP